MTSRMGPLLPIVTVSPAFPCETGQLGLGLCVVGQKALPRHLVGVFSGPDSVACAWRNVFCPTAAVASFWLHGAGVVLIVVFVVRIGFGVVVGVGNLILKFKIVDLGNTEMHIAILWFPNLRIVTFNYISTTIASPAYLIATQSCFVMAFQFIANALLRYCSNITFVLLLCCHCIWNKEYCIIILSLLGIAYTVVRRNNGAVGRA